MRVLRVVHSSRFAGIMTYSRFMFSLICAGMILLLSTVTQESLASDITTGWSFEKSLRKNFKNYGYQVVKSQRGHPVCDGKLSMRFEIRAGDCSWSSGWSDCENDRERHELASKSDWGKGEHWYHWSIYIPRDYEIIFPVKIALGQFHQHDDHPVFMFQNARGGYHVDNQTIGYTLHQNQILTDEDMRGRWTDILVHAHWTHKSDGFFRVYVNGSVDPSYVWSGKTKNKGKRVYFKLGIYRSFVSRRPGDEPTQVVYYDSVAKAKSCEKATKFFNCEAIRQTPYE